MRLQFLLLYNFAKTQFIGRSSELTNSNQNFLNFDNGFLKEEKDILLSAEIETVPLLVYKWYRLI